ncbi:hypothetical protein J2W39_004520 [Variovorax paradoxus]|uniref:Uncharacterized protein n=1 Tax=Variovorax paradoxus TaxID=34073 RepID=A0AAW8EKB9_VARPD|nr:hypothetical protein [Variovorax paradoxus]MDP9973273.1 hypothetical protein [Variovorax paradoxus]
MSIYKWATSIPVLGMILTITNNYVAGGDFSADDEFAPLTSWIKALWSGVVISVALTVLTLWQQCQMTSLGGCLPKDAFVALPGTIAISVLPNILGFGIGVYALIFALSEKFVKMFHEAAQRANANGEKISVLTLNADMAYPLMVIIIAIAVGLLQQVFKESVWLLVGSWFMVWYSLVKTAGLIGVIFRIGEQALLDKIDAQ